MNVAATIARILLGVLFTVVGVLPFVMSAPPPQPGQAGTFTDLAFHTHWVLFVAAAQIIIGVLFLSNRFVPIALIMLAAFIYNSFAFHLTMAPSALPAPVALLALWLVIAAQYRSKLAVLA